MSKYIKVMLSKEIGKIINRYLLIIDKDEEYDEPENCYAYAKDCIMSI